MLVQRGVREESGESGTDAFEIAVDDSARMKMHQSINYAAHLTNPKYPYHPG